MDSGGGDKRSRGFLHPGEGGRKLCWPARRLLRFAFIVHNYVCRLSCQFFFLHQVFCIICTVSQGDSRTFDFILWTVLAIIAPTACA